LFSLTAPLGMLLHPVVEKAKSGDDFRLDELRKKRMTIFIGVVPTEIGTFRNLFDLFFKKAMIDVNVKQGLPENNPALKYQCLLLMDDIPAFGKMSVIVNAVAFIAGYNLRLCGINQSPYLPEDIYGKEAARTLTTNFACLVLYTPCHQ
ncbi:type IV secretory system conjugative DNA transfer family protein, partial [Kingella kingae]|uniref:type IV secretory system conjugative DNA transfer family protein n=1 Tax=Kingella kingae TaxID=504 RepID=UPI001FCCA15F